MFDLKKGLRKRSEMATIETTTVKDLVKAANADEFRLVENAEGTKFVHILNTDTEDYYTIKVGKKVTSTAKGEKLIADLIQNHTIYCGETENGIWFTFGPEPSTNEPVAVVSVEKLMKGLQRSNAAQ